MFRKTLGPRNIKVNGGQFRRSLKLIGGSLVLTAQVGTSFMFQIDDTNSEARANSLSLLRPLPRVAPSISDYQIE